MHQPGYTVVDTAPLRGAEAFERLQEQSRKSPMPWTVDYLKGAVRSRAEIVGLENGAIVRGQATPTFTSVRNAKNIAQSDAEFYYLVLLRSGSMALSQGDERSVIRPGDVAVMSGQERSSFCPASTRTGKYLSLVIVGEACSRLRGIEKRLGNLLIPRTQGSDPLRQCLSALARDFHEHSAAEATALFKACTHLLEAHCWREPVAHNHDGRTRTLLQFIDRHIADPGLSVGMAASALAVSERRVHQLCAEMGTTFGRYVAEQRIRCAAVDLHSSREHRIAEIAYRYGFSELSTFRRAFRRVLGCTPSEFRKSMTVR